MPHDKPQDPPADSPADPPADRPSASSDAPRDASLNDERAVPLEGRTAREWTPALEALAAAVFEGDAPAWWGAPNPHTWDAPPRALLASLSGARRIRRVLLGRYRSDHGVFS